MPVSGLAGNPQQDTVFVPPLSAITPPLATRLRVTTSGLTASIYLRVEGVAANFNASASIYENDPTGAALQTHTFTAANQEIGPTGASGMTATYANLTNRPIGFISAGKRWYAKVTDALGNVTWAFASADRDAIPSGSVALSDYKTSPSITVNYDDDTTSVKVTVPGGRTKTYGSLSGSGSVTYTVGDTLDNATTESALAVDAVTSAYTVQVINSTLTRTVWTAPLHGAPSAAPFTESIVVVGANNNYAQMTVTLRSPRGENVTLRVRDSESASAPVWTMVTGNGVTSTSYVAPNTQIAATQWFYNGTTWSNNVIGGIPVQRDLVQRRYLQAVGQSSAVQGPWDTVVIEAQQTPYLESLDVTWNETADTLDVSCRAGAFVNSVFIEVDDNADFSSVYNTGGRDFTSGVSNSYNLSLSSVQRNQKWYVRATPYGSVTSGGVPQGISGPAQTGSVFVPASDSGGIEPPKCIIENFTNSTTQATTRITIQAGAGATATVGTWEYRTRTSIDNGGTEPAWGAWTLSTNPVDITVARDAYYKKVLSVQVRDDADRESQVMQGIIMPKRDHLDPPTGYHKRNWLFDDNEYASRGDNSGHLTVPVRATGKNLLSGTRSFTGVGGVVGGGNGSGITWSIVDTDLGDGSTKRAVTIATQTGSNDIVMQIGSTALSALGLKAGDTVTFGLDYVLSASAVDYIMIRQLDASSVGLGDCTFTPNTGATGGLDVVRAYAKDGRAYLTVTLARASVARMQVFWRGPTAVGQVLTSSKWKLEKGSVGTGWTDDADHFDFTTTTPRFSKTARTWKTDGSTFPVNQAFDKGNDALSNTLEAVPDYAAGDRYGATNNEKKRAIEALPDSVAVGGIVPVDIRINTVTGGGANPGEVWYDGGTQPWTFTHPNGTSWVIPNNAETVTTFEAGSTSGIVSYLMAMYAVDSTARDARFTMNSSENVTRYKYILAVRYLNGQWQYDTNATWTNFTPVDNDCIIGKIVSDNTLGIGTLKRYALKRIPHSMDVGGVRAGYVSRAQHGVFLEPFDDSAGASEWVLNQGTGTQSVVNGNGQTGGSVLQIVGPRWIIYPYNIPYDPSKLYRMRVRVRQTVANTVAGTSQDFYSGVVGVAADGVTLINSAGTNTYSNQHVLCSGVVSPLPADSVYREYTGWFKGTGSTNVATFASPNANAPKTLYTGVRYFRPYILANWSGGTGTAELDYIAIDVFDEDGATRTYNGLDTNGDLSRDIVSTRKYSGDSTVIGRSYYDYITNQDFDIWPNASMPFGWSQQGTVTVARESTIKASGFYSLKLSNPDTTTNGGFHGVQSFDGNHTGPNTNFIVPLKPGRIYRASIMSRISRTGGAGGAKFRLFFYHDVAQTMSSEIQWTYTTASTTGFVAFEGNIAVPPRTNWYDYTGALNNVATTAEPWSKCYIQVWRPDTTAADFYFDSIEFEELPTVLRDVKVEGQLEATVLNIDVGGSLNMEDNATALFRGQTTFTDAGGTPTTHRRLIAQDGTLALHGVQSDGTPGTTQNRVVVGDYQVLTAGSAVAASDTTWETSTTSTVSVYGANTVAGDPTSSLNPTNTLAHGTSIVAHDRRYTITGQIKAGCTADDGPGTPIITATALLYYSLNGGAYTLYGTIASASTTGNGTTSGPNTYSQTITLPGNTAITSLSFRVVPQVDCSTDFGGGYCDVTNTTTTHSVSWNYTTGTSVGRRGLKITGDNGQPSFLLDGITTMPTATTAVEGEYWWNKNQKRLEWHDGNVVRWLPSVKFDYISSTVSGTTSYGTVLSLDVKSGDVWVIEANVLVVTSGSGYFIKFTGGGSTTLSGNWWQNNRDSAGENFQTGTGSNAPGTASTTNGTGACYVNGSLTCSGDGQILLQVGSSGANAATAQVGAHWRCYKMN